MQGMPGFDPYAADPSMYNVHKFMDLNPYQLGYFVQQVGMAAASFGVAESDVTAVGMALNSLFGLRCAPPTAAVPAQGPQLQAICIDGACPISPNATCASYEMVVVPANASTSSTATAPGSMGTATAASSGTGSSATMSGTMSATSTAKPSGSGLPTSGATARGLSFVAVAGSVAAAFFI